MSAILHNYIMEYCKRSRISSFECATHTPSAFYLTCECALIGTRAVGLERGRVCRRSPEV
jgi:hypothetical protein